VHSVLLGTPSSTFWEAKNAGRDDIASFFVEFISWTADRCREFLRQFGDTDNTSPHS
jgi:hypothetical protein